MTARKRIAVHDQTFHADDTLAVYFLLQTEEFRSSEIVRTRDPSVYESCDCVVDVGGVYDHERRRYDHHQPGCEEAFPRSLVPFASCGLVYRHFGREVLHTLLQRRSFEVSGDAFEYVYESLYFQFVQEIDATDNGISQVPATISPRYENCTGITTRIKMKNPHWKSENADCDLAFRRAIEYIGQEFEGLVYRCVQYGLKELEMTRTGFSGRFALDESGEIMEIPRFFTYLTYLKRIEGDNPQVNFIIYPREDGTWTIRGVGTGRGFELRKSLPHAGVSPKELSELTSIPGAIFSHKNALIAVFDNRSHALAFAKYAVRQIGRASCRERV
jgi:uncharacterized UPF0160 family protein